MVSRRFKRADVVDPIAAMATGFKDTNELTCVWLTDKKNHCERNQCQRILAAPVTPLHRLHRLQRDQRHHRNQRNQCISAPRGLARDQRISVTSVPPSRTRFATSLKRMASCFGRTEVPDTNQAYSRS